jgi:hypothetical protein
MKKLLALLPASLLFLQGCGDSCTTASTTIIPAGTQTCNGASGSAFTVSVRPSCQTCAQSSPICDISPTAVPGQVQLDARAQECDSNKGCSAPSCSFGNVSCTITPSASGPLDILYLPASGGSAHVTVTVDTMAGAVSCTI